MKIRSEVLKKIDTLEKKGDKVDIITFLPNGEPTLDIDLGSEIRRVQETGSKVGVISNSSLLGSEEVRNDLSYADWVSVKIDSVDKEEWKTINRPHKSLNIDVIQDGIVEFSKGFKGDLVSETMLIDKINNSQISIQNTAFFLHEAGIKRSYLSTPTRPPTEKWVKPASTISMFKAARTFIDKGIETELLVEFEGADFSLSDSSYKDILDIVSVHPIREDALRKLMIDEGLEWKEIENMLKLGLIKRISHTGHRFYIENT